MKHNIRANYIDDIEILRAFAILLIVFAHLKPYLCAFDVPYVKQFYYYFSGTRGVDLFFVISGFVITKSLLPKLQITTSAVGFFRESIVFWIRRFWRLIPSAWLWLIIPLFLCVFFNQSGEFGTFKGNFAGFVAGLLNVFNLYFNTVFANAEYSNSVFVHWTLSLEMQFYLILPFIVFLVPKRLPLLLFLLVIVQLLLFQKTWAGVLRTDAFFIGVLIAMWQQKKSTYLDFDPTFLEHPLARAIFLGLIFLGLMTMSSKLGIVPNHQRKSIAALVSAVAVIAASYNQNYFIRTKWLKKTFLWIGSRSYAIYLIHVPVNKFVREAYFRYSPNLLDYDYWLLPTVVFSISNLILIIILSELNFRFIEEPFRKKGRAIANNYLNKHSE